MDDVHGVLADESGQRRQTRRNKGIPHQTGQTRVDTADAAADHGGDQGLFQFEDNTVEAGFGDAHDGRKTGGSGQLAQLMVLGLAGNGQRGTALGDVGSQHAGAVDDLISQRGDLHGGNGGHGPGRTGEHQERLEGTHEHGQQPAGAGIDGVGSGFDQGIEESAEGADHQQCNGGRDEKNDQRLEEEFDHRGGVFFRKALHIGHDPDAEDDGNDRVGVIHQPHRDAEEVHCFPGRDHSGPGGVQQSAGQGHGQHGVAFKLDGSTISQQYRHKVEGRIGHKVEDLISRTGIGQAAQHQDGQHGFDHTAADQRRNDRREGRGDHADDPVDDGLLFLRFRVGCRGTAGRRAAHLVDKGAVGDGHIVAHDHLELAALFHHTDDTRGLFDGFFVHLAAVVEFKPQPGGTVGQFADILRTAHQRQQIIGQFFIIHT